MSVKFIIGIGNPGKKYEHTRHNIGFVSMDALIKHLSGSQNWKETPELKAEAHAGDDIFLVKPSTFVNHTGETLKAIEGKYHPALKDILVVCDDVNLRFGKLRLRDSGSAGGHHGLESAIEALGSEDFPRLRIGVGAEEMPKDLEGFVLEQFSGEESKKIAGLSEKTVLICESWIGESFQAAQGRLSQLQSKE